MKGKLSTETVRPYRISDSEILIREKLMIVFLTLFMSC